MKTILVFFCALLATGIAFGLPPAPFVHIQKIEGTVVELPKGDGILYAFVKMTVSATSSPEDTKNLYSTIRRKTRYPIQDQKRPGKGEVILVVRPNDLPKGTKVGDKLRLFGYGLRGSEESGSHFSTNPYVEKIELNPKD
jgi:hypothetical protein